jgi:CRP-like cAMP-binding protein
MAMASSSPDTRRLKDQVVEFLRKQKPDKAAELLEQLVRAEPRDMQHRLKLGDAYRRLGIEEKAIAAYGHVSRFYADEGQIIKAIAAIKLILEVDPRDAQAKAQLAEMTNRRFARPTVEVAGLQVAKGIGAGARGVSAIELADGEKAAADISRFLESGGPVVPPSPQPAGETIDFDDAAPAPPPKASPRHGPPPGPKDGPRHGSSPRADPRRPPTLTRSPPAPPRSATIVLSPPVARFELPRDAGLDGLQEEGVQLGIDEIVESGEPLDAAPASARPTAPRPPPARPALLQPSAGQMDLSPALSVQDLPDEAIVEEDLEVGAREQIAALVMPPNPPPPGDDLPIAPPAPRVQQVGPPRPIADLFVVEDGDDSGEEIELLSIRSDEELPTPSAPATPPLAASGAELDAAFGAIAAAAPPPPPRRLPSKVPLFDDLSEDAFVSFVTKLGYRRWQPGELILTEGEPGRSFFVIVEGRVRVFKNVEGGPGFELAQLGEGAFFGEMALLSGTPRAASVAAVEETELLEITDTALRELVEAYPGVVRSLKDFYRQRLLNNVMTISPLFKDFDPSERRSIAERFKMRQVGAGDVLITEGKNSDGLYVVLHGQVRVEKVVEDGQEVPLALLKEGDLFGEISLLTRKPAIATVSATGNTILLKLPRENFQELILTHPQILELVSQLSEVRKSATAAVLSGHGPGHDGMSYV